MTRRNRQPAKTTRGGKPAGGQFAPDRSGRNGIAAPDTIPVPFGAHSRPMIAQLVRVSSGRGLGGLVPYAHVVEGSVVLKTLLGITRRHAEARARRWAKPRTAPVYRHPVLDITGTVQQVPVNARPVGAVIPTPGANSLVTFEWQDDDGTTRQAQFDAASLPAALVQ